MKNIFTALVLLSVCFCGYAQTLYANKVPQKVKDAFIKAHPASTTSWESEDANYEANFKEGGQTMSCVINKQGTILETESSITETELPVNAKKYMNTHYKGKQWKEVTKIVKANGEVNYEVNVGTDVLFDSKGNHLGKKQEKEKD